MTATAPTTRYVLAKPETATDADGCGARSGAHALDASRCAPLVQLALSVVTGAVGAKVGGVASPRAHDRMPTAARRVTWPE